ncbi:MAG: uracil-DNA glycosylase family protein [Gammaproteobacteria bacterium]|nr:uracil-DNA glycosylase family protein [Gammaproteobacteria bacterium]
MTKTARTLKKLLTEVRACRACELHLPLGPKPVIRASHTARLLIVGQAPGTRVHASGLSWNDPSGDRLRDWMAIDRDIFYDEARIAILPMGFCYPGKGARGDLPPRAECAALWRAPLHAALPQIEFTLLIGQYAQRYYLGKRKKATLADTVHAWREYLPHYLPLPHPSPRNILWFRRNPWFEREVVPALRAQVRARLFPGTAVSARARKQ